MKTPQVRKVTVVLAVAIGLAVLPDRGTGGQAAPAKRFVYLTFDDGPLPGTDDCLAVLKEKKAAASFLMVGMHTATPFGKKQVEGVAAGKFLLGNHSFSHWHQASNYGPPPAGKTDQQWLADFQAADKALAGLTGQPGHQFTYARLPGKNAWRAGTVTADDGNSKRVADHLAAKGYVIFGWDVEWEYTGTAAASDPKQTPDEMAGRVKAALAGGAAVKSPGKVVVLLHDHQFRESRKNKVKLADFLDRLTALQPPVTLRTLDTYLKD